MGEVVDLEKYIAEKFDRLLIKYLNRFTEAELSWLLREALAKIGDKEE